MLENYGVWDAVATQVYPYTTVEVWDQSSGQTLSWTAHAVQVPNLGYMISHRRLWQALWRVVQTLPQISVIWECSLVSARTHEGGWMLSDRQGNHWLAALVIGADGGRSWVRESMGFPFHVHHYGQMAIVATVEMEAAESGSAYQRFSPEGPLAFLPSPISQQWSIVWSMPTAQAHVRMALSESAFEETLWLESDQRLGRCRLQSARTMFPLHRLESVLHRSRAVLIGDAAHLIHPLAGQGMNMGIQDARRIVATLEKAHRYKIPFGDATVLTAYARESQLYHQSMQWGMAGIKALFENTHPWVVWARDRGMGLLHQQPWIKNTLAHVALGTWSSV
ncbi:hypothetical protein EBZ35_08725 [bacterium]|nr:hypothetical protein [bacterium]